MPLVGLIDERGSHVEWADVAKGMGEFSDPPNLLMALYRPDEMEDLRRQYGTQSGRAAEAEYTPPPKP